MLPPLVHRSACSPRTHIGLSCARRCHLCSRACLDHVSTLSLLCIFSMCFSFFQSVRLNFLRLFHSPAFSWCFCRVPALLLVAFRISSCCFVGPLLLGLFFVGLSTTGLLSSTLIIVLPCLLLFSPSVGLFKLPFVHHTFQCVSSVGFSTLNDQMIRAANWQSGATLPLGVWRLFAHFHPSPPPSQLVLWLINLQTTKMLFLHFSVYNDTAKKTKKCIDSTDKMPDDLGLLF